MRKRRRLYFTDPKDWIHDSIRYTAQGSVRGQVPAPPPGPPCRVERFAPPWEILWAALFPWRTVRDNGKTVYQINHRNGKRRAWQRPGGYQPIDQHWINTGQWSTYGVEPSEPWPRT